VIESEQLRELAFPTDIMTEDYVTDDGFNATADCPDYDRSGELLLDSLSYWLEGVIQVQTDVSGDRIFNLVLVALRRLLRVACPADHCP
jgi:hypothetical protein